MVFTDDHGEWPVVEWRVYYPQKITYRSCTVNSGVDNPELINALPASDVQGIGWLFYKHNQIRGALDCGRSDEPTIYKLGNRELIGTMLSDDEFNELNVWMLADLVRHVAYYNGR